jgi:hypothetical protein
MTMTSWKRIALALLTVSGAACSAQPPNGQVELAGYSAKSSMGFSAADALPWSSSSGTITWTGGQEYYQVAPSGGIDGLVLNVDLGAPNEPVFEVHQCGGRYVGNVDCRPYIQADAVVTVTTPDGVLAETAAPATLHIYGPDEWQLVADVDVSDFQGSFRVTNAPPGAFHYWVSLKYKGGALSGDFGGTTVSSTSTTENGGATGFVGGDIVAAGSR